MPKDVRSQAHIDAAQPIGFGQTISQPTVVRIMLEWLGVEPGNKILDVGSGSGWTTALLSRLTGPDGFVHATEAVPELVEFGRENCARLDILNANFYRVGNRLGLPDKAPFDRILVSAGAIELPQELLRQLKPGSKMVVPVGSDILELSILDDGTTQQSVHHGFAFVPLV